MVANSILRLELRASNRNALKTITSFMQYSGRADVQAENARDRVGCRRSRTYLGPELIGTVVADRSVKRAGK